MPETDALQVRIRTVEDLFEEEPKELDIDDLSDAIPSFGRAGDVAGPRAPESAGNDTIVTGTDDDIVPDDNEPDEADNPTDEDETDEDEADKGDDESTSGQVQSYEAGSPSFSRQQWFDLMKWAHNSEALSHENRIRFIKLGRLIQKGRRLTGRQEAQLAELVTLAHAMGYQIKK